MDPPATAGLAPWFNLALWLAGLAHFCILGAGIQVPYRLKWKEDLAKLMPFNRKIFTVYYGYIASMIAAFAVMTFALHAELMRGDRTALWLAGFMGTFWTARVAIDALYFDHADWPKGRAMALGHIVLTSTFVALAGTYWGLIIWQAL